MRSCQTQQKCGEYNDHLHHWRSNDRLLVFQNEMIPFIFLVSMAIQVSFQKKITSKGKVVKKVEVIIIFFVAHVNT